MVNYKNKNYYNNYSRKKEWELRFILVSSRKLKTQDILPVYYSKQQIEQVFHIIKNHDNNTLPIKIQTESTFRGHLLLTFIATAIIKKIHSVLLPTKFNPISMFIALRGHKCKVFDNKIITNAPFKIVSDCYKLFQLECPAELPL
jgi:transposase